jgi:lipopolysaccharide transport system ATP-binding protein
MAAVGNLCRTGILLQRGRLATGGRIEDVITRYLASMTGPESTDLGDRVDRQGNGRLRFLEVKTVGSSADQAGIVLGQPAGIVLRYQGTPPLRNVHVSIGLHTPYGEGALYLGTDVVGQDFASLPASGSLKCCFDRFPLLPGSYMANIYCTVNGVLADWVMDAARIDVTEGDYYGTGRLPPPGYGTVVVPYGWELVADQAG